MRKKYLSNEYETGEIFWDKNFQNSSINDAIKFCEISPVRPVLDTYFPKKGKLLDGGCGLGQFVFYYKNRGYDIEGVDFAPKVIKRILDFDNTTKVQIGDILKLPYPDNYFSAYYSGGVVEHLEEGPKKALKEAYRVLKKEAFLIITVPYFNLSRKLSSYLFYGFGKRKASDVKLDFNGMKTRFLLTNLHQRTASPFKGFSFHQYEYTKKELSRILNECGFDAIFCRGISIIWGLMDSPFLQKLINKMFSSQNNELQKSFANNGEKKPKAAHLGKRVKSYLKRIFISEDYSLRFGKLLLKILQFTSANLILFVCKVRKNGF